jgi:signal transduction histidine kinase
LINETAGYVKDLFSFKEEYKDDPELVENIDEILEAVERCGTITRQLLGFARKFDMNVQKVDLKDALGDVLDFHKKEAEYRNISVSVDISEDLPEIVTDRGKLQQVLVNLVNNAFHAMADGCCLRIEGRSSGADKVDIVVSDTGCGISEENMKKIFEPFFTTKSEGKGTGLGLYITYGLIRKLQGELKVESEENLGSTFTITLPVQIREEETV